ncbi:MAG: orotidine-5'-phosphate decarboxylase, partial [Elusimicrobia bacterium]|nr:orotidine-5'-phosphate decarboxylase [Elusimicrobiota bacterium]MBD3412384.1 orotidine-5'-phosphate decarboxylase [Elusimicrobiota bacterium]
ACGRPVLERIVSMEHRPLIWGISMLTSIDEQVYQELGLQKTIIDQVVRLAELGASCGVDGIVCSPNEVAVLKKRAIVGGRGITLITPGIRMGTAVERDDQKRAATPSFARQQGADFIVVGRPVLEAPVPARAAAMINNELRAV